MLVRQQCVDASVILQDSGESDIVFLKAFADDELPCELEFRRNLKSAGSMSSSTLDDLNSPTMRLSLGQSTGGLSNLTTPKGSAAMPQQLALAQRQADDLRKQLRESQRDKVVEDARQEEELASQVAAAQASAQKEVDELRRKLLEAEQQRRAAVSEAEEQARAQTGAQLLAHREVMDALRKQLDDVKQEREEAHAQLAEAAHARAAEKELLRREMEDFRKQAEEATAHQIEAIRAEALARSQAEEAEKQTLQRELEEVRKQAEEAKARHIEEANRVEALARAEVEATEKEIMQRELEEVRKRVEEAKAQQVKETTRAEALLHAQVEAQAAAQREFDELREQLEDVTQQRAEEVARVEQEHLQASASLKGNVDKAMAELANLRGDIVGLTQKLDKANAAAQHAQSEAESWQRQAVRAQSQVEKYLQQATHDQQNLESASQPTVQPIRSIGEASVLQDLPQLASIIDEPQHRVEERVSSASEAFKLVQPFVLRPSVASWYQGLSRVKPIQSLGQQRLFEQEAVPMICSIDESQSAALGSSAAVKQEGPPRLKQDESLGLDVDKIQPQSMKSSIYDAIPYSLRPSVGTWLRMSLGRSHAQDRDDSPHDLALEVYEPSPDNKVPFPAHPVPLLSLERTLPFGSGFRSPTGLLQDVPVLVPRLRANKRPTRPRRPEPTLEDGRSSTQLAKLFEIIQPGLGSTTGSFISILEA